MGRLFRNEGQRRWMMVQKQRILKPFPDKISLSISASATNVTAGKIEGSALWKASCIRTGFFPLESIRSTAFDLQAQFSFTLTISFSIQRPPLQYICSRILSSTAPAFTSLFLLILKLMKVHVQNGRSSYPQATASRSFLNSSRA